VLTSEHFHYIKQTNTSVLCSDRGNGKVALCFLVTEHHAMKSSYWGSGGIAPLIP
jgi:hypothetical protein